MATSPDYITSINTAQPEIWSAPFVIPRGHLLVSAGQVCQHLYFVESGAVRVYFVAENQEHTIRLGYKGNIINDLPSFLSQQPGRLYIEAIKKSVIKKAHINAIYTLRDSEKKMTDLWIATLENLFLQQFEREIDLLITAPEARYQRVLQRSPQLFQEVPHKYIAAYLRMTPETLSRIQKS